jgi:hypothetical protein
MRVLRETGLLSSIALKRCRNSQSRRNRLERIESTKRASKRALREHFSKKST